MYIPVNPDSSIGGALLPLLSHFLYICSCNEADCIHSKHLRCEAGVLENGGARCTGIQTRAVDVVCGWVG